MKRLFLYIIILYNVLLLAGCHDHTSPPSNPVPQPRAEAERTVIIYMAADNSLSGSVTLDTTEMVRGKSQIPEDMNVLVYIDDRKLPAIYELSAKNGLQLWKQFKEEQCSTDSLTMLNVLRDIVYMFPARHYGLSMWSHATGWAPRRNTFGKDENRGASAATMPEEMELSVLHDVLAHLPKFDYIFFDACFMQCIEVAYELRNVTSYMVGSPAEIPGPGAPYDKVISALCKGDAKGIVEGYDSGYPGTYNYYYYPGVLLSCIDCSQLDALAEATGRLLTPFYMEHAEPSANGFQAYCSFLNKYTHYFDMRTTMCRLLSEDDYLTWMELFDKAVPLRKLSSSNTWFASFCSDPTVRDPECYGGVSMFVPMEKYNNYGWNEDFQKTSWYAVTGWQRTGW